MKLRRWLAIVLSAATTSAMPLRAQQGAPQFIGPASCNASSCHGAGAARTTGIAQDEYVKWWYGRDGHRQAFAVLAQEQSRKIADRLGIADAASARECLACHALPADAPARRPDELREFGVGCEQCHGAASQWYGTHFQPGWRETSAPALGGMIDLRDDPARVAQQCVGCHVGSESRAVDHRLIAAGHPDLFFETGTFLLGMPPHWRQGEKTGRRWFQRAALSGSLTALRAELDRLSRDATAGAGAPDFSDFQCISCHHDLAGASWIRLDAYRREVAPSRSVGQPRLERARSLSASAVATAVEPRLGSLLDAKMAELEEVVARRAGAKGDVAAAALAAAGVCDTVLAALLVADVEGVAARTCENLGNRSRPIAAGGEKSAAEAACLLLSLKAEFVADRWEFPGGSDAEEIRVQLLPPFLRWPLVRLDRFDPADFALRFERFAR
jgi:hypothetical protein